MASASAKAMNQGALGIGAISVYGDAEEYRDRHHDAPRIGTPMRSS